MIAPRLVRFTSEDTQWSSRKSAVVPVPRQSIEYAQVGDVFLFRDTRGKKRKLRVMRKDKNGLRLECHKTAYIATGTKLKLKRQESGEKISFRVGKLPPIEEPIVLNEGDTLILHGDSTPGEPAVVDADGLVVKPAHISCRQPEVFCFIAAGELGRLNDGKIESLVKTLSGEEMLFLINHAKSAGRRGSEETRGGEARRSWGSTVH